MLVGHFDESGLDAQSASFWLGGYVARMETWYEFSRAWRRTLGERGVETLHTSDLMNFRGEFKGWNARDREVLLNDLISIINSSNLVGIGAGIVKADYQRLVVDSGFLKEVGLSEPWWKHPYLLVFQQLVLEAVLGAKSLPTSDRITFIFEQQDTYAFRCKKVFADMSDPRIWPRADRLGSPQFIAKADCTPLQAADLLVYELRKRLDHQLKEPHRPTRPRMERLRRNLASNCFMTAAEIPTFLEEVRASRTARIS